MRSELVFNDLSATGSSRDKYEAQKALKNFINLFKDARGRFSDRLLVGRELGSIKLLEDYTVSQCLRDLGSHERKYVSAFYAMMNRSKKIRTEEGDRDKEMVTKADRYSDTLLYAYLENQVLISFPVDEYKESMVSLILRMLREGNLVEEPVQMPNISKKEHLASKPIRAFLRDERVELLNDFCHPDLFWEHRRALYPNMIFCDNVKRHLKKIDPPTFSDNLRKVEVLHQFFRNWDWGSFDYTDIPGTSPQSADTLKKYRAEHTFETPDGKVEVFSYHIKGASHKTRVYFTLNHQKKKVIIGSIGKHLPCVKYGKIG